MKKIILSILFVSFLVNAFSQTVDSTVTFHAKDRGNSWYKASNVPGWLIDGIRATTIAGDTFVRVDKNGVFYAEVLKIYANGNDMTSRINNAVNLSYVKEIHFISDSARKYIINGSVDFQGKTIVVGNGCILSGSGTVSNIVVKAGDYEQVFDTTLSVSNIKSSAGYISVGYFGAKGDGTTDDTKAIQMAMEMSNSTIKLPEGNFKTTKTVKLDSTNNFDGSKGFIIPTGVSGGGIIIGSDTVNSAIVSSITGKSYFIQIKRSSQSNWADSLTVTDIGILAKNIYRSEIKCVSSGFTFPLIMKGIKSSGGFVENKIYPIAISEGYVGIWGTKEGNGYFNSNTIIAPSIRISTNINTGEAAYGIRIGTEGDSTYLHNNNIVQGGSIQLNGNNRIAFDLIYSYQGKFLDWRNESNGLPVIFKNTSDQNIVRPGYNYANTTYIDVSKSGGNIYEDVMNQILTSANSYTAFSWTATGNSTAYDNDNVNLKKIGIWRGDGLPVNYISSDDMEIYPDFIKIKRQYIAVGAEFDSRNTKKFLIKHSHVGDSVGRILIVMFDKNGDRLISNPPRTSGIGVNYTTSWGGGWRTSQNTKNDIYVNLIDSCERVRFIFVGEPISINCLKSFSIQTVSNNSTNISFKSNEENVALSKPVSTGTYEVGQQIYNVSQSNHDSILYWLVKSAGTNRILTSATGTISSNSNEVTLTGVSADSIYVGEYLNINNNKYRIENVINGKLYLSSNVPSYYSGNINYYPAEFVEVKQGKGTSISGGGGILIDNF